jgi:hypothetical protein
MLRFAVALIPCATAAVPAFAQTVSGQIDPATGLSSLSTYVLGLVSSVMIIVAAWKGTHAFMEGRSIGPIAVGLLAGLVLAFGGYYILQHYGVSSTTGA